MAGVVHESAPRYRVDDPLARCSLSTQKRRALNGGDSTSLIAAARKTRLSLRGGIGDDDRRLQCGRGILPGKRSRRGETDGKALHEILVAGTIIEQRKRH